MEISRFGVFVFEDIKMTHVNSSDSRATNADNCTCGSGVLDLGFVDYLKTNTTLTALDVSGQDK